MMSVLPTAPAVNPLSPTERALACGIVRWMAEAGGPIEAVEARLLRYLALRERISGAAHYGRIRHALATDARGLIWSAIWGAA